MAFLHGRDVRNHGSSSCRFVWLARVNEEVRKGERWEWWVPDFPGSCFRGTHPSCPARREEQNNVWYFALIRPCGTKHSGLIWPDSPDSTDHQAMARAHKPLAPKAAPEPQNPRGSALGSALLVAESGDAVAVKSMALLHGCDRCGCVHSQIGTAEETARLRARGGLRHDPRLPRW